MTGLDEKLELFHRGSNSAAVNLLSGLLAASVMVVSQVAKLDGFLCDNDGRHADAADISDNVP
jgi:hypothetical protein